MRNEERLSRIAYLSYRELRRFLFAVWGNNGQWYWTEVGGIEYPNIRLIGVSIRLPIPQTFYGVEVYDEEGELVCWGEFNFPRHCEKGNLLTVSHQFIAETPMASIEINS